MEEAKAMGTQRQPAIISPKNMTRPKVEMKVLVVLAVLTIIHPKNMANPTVEGKVLKEKPAPPGGGV